MQMLFLKSVQLCICVSGWNAYSVLSIRAARRAIFRAAKLFLYMQIKKQPLFLESVQLCI